MKTTELIAQETSPERSLILAGPGALDQNAAAVYLGSLTSSTGRRTQMQALNVMADLLTGGRANAFTMEWGKLRYQHTAALRAQLISRYSPATVNKFLSALRGALRNAWRLGKMTAEEFERATDLQSVTGDTLPAGRELAAGEISALMEACEADQSLNGIRDGALIAVMYLTGLRPRKSQPWTWSTMTRRPAGSRSRASDRKSARSMWPTAPPMRSPTGSAPAGNSQAPSSCA